MVEKENLKFLGYEISKSSYETRTGVKGGPAKFTDKNGGIHTRNGFGNETIYWPAKHLVFGKEKNGQTKVTDIFKTIFSIYGKLKKAEREKIARNIMSAIKYSGWIPAVSYEGSKFVWIAPEGVQNLNKAGTILENFDTFQEPYEYF